tara:strand:- start:1960 stop:2124 length:165 start_codon:yes stop_codon:yes gene_type:complete
LNAYESKASDSTSSSQSLKFKILAAAGIVALAISLIAPIIKIIRWLVAMAGLQI